MSPTINNSVTGIMTTVMEIAMKSRPDIKTTDAVIYITMPKTNEGLRSSAGFDPQAATESDMHSTMVTKTATDALG